MFVGVEHIVRRTCGYGMDVVEVHCWGGCVRGEEQDAVSTSQSKPPETQNRKHLKKARNGQNKKQTLAPRLLQLLTLLSLLTNTSHCNHILTLFVLLVCRLSLFLLHFHHPHSRYVSTGRHHPPFLDITAHTTRPHTLHTLPYARHRHTALNAHPFCHRGVSSLLNEWVHDGNCWRSSHISPLLKRIAAPQSTIGQTTTLHNQW